MEAKGILWKVRAGATAFAVAFFVVGIAAGPAHADDRDHRDRRHFQHRPPPPNWGYDQPTYVPAPPPVVYAPPIPPAGINFSLNLR